MRTNIEIDDELMATVMALGGFRTKRQAVEAGLRLIKNQADRQKILRLKGRIAWGDANDERLSGAPNVVRSSAPGAKLPSGRVSKPTSRATHGRR